MNLLPEHESVLTFVQFLLDDEGKLEYMPGDSQRIAEREGRTMAEVRRDLDALGLKMVIRRTPEVRGFTSNPHNRYSDPSNRTYGGSGGVEVLTGFAPPPAHTRL